MDRKYRLIVLAAAGLGWSSAGLAADAPDSTPAESSALEEIVVTAEKRVEPLQDVPLTVNVVQGDQLQKLNLFNFQDVQLLTPGLDLQNTDGREQAASLRGVRFDNDTGTTPTVDIYFNELPIQATDAFQAQYDLEQIETVRGPQGTLRGQPSPSGAVLLTTRRPSFTDYDGYFSATGAQLDTQNYQGAFGGPITSNLAFRVAALYDRSDDQGSTDIITGQRDGHTTRSGRVSLEWRPIDTVDVSLVHQELNSSNVMLRDVAGTGSLGTFGTMDFKSITNGTNSFTNRSSITALTATWDVAGQRVTYVGGYQQTHFNTVRDLDLGNFLTGYEEYQGVDVGRRQLTNELRLERVGENFWNYRVGAYFEDDRLPVSLDIDYTGGNGACGGFLAAFGLPCERSSYTVPTRQKGFFTTNTFTITHQDVVEIGVRYSDSYAGANPTDPLSTSVASHATTGSASYKHRFTTDLLGYVNYGRGFRPGGIDLTGLETTSTTIPSSLFSYRPEYSNAYEGGLKAAFLEHRIELDVSGYFQKFDNFINRVNALACTGNPFSGVGPGPGLVYATNDGTAPSATNPLGCNGAQLSLTYNGAASTRGIEVDSRFRITPRWHAQLTASYADAHYDDALIPCNDYNGSGVPNQAGTPAVQAGRSVSLCRSNGSLGLPTFYASATTEYAFPLSDTLEGVLRGLESYRNSVTQATTNVTTPSEPRLDLFVGIRGTNVKWEVDVFAKNVFDRIDAINNGETYNLFTGAPTGYDVYYYTSVGRVVGATIRYNFGK